MPLGNKVFGLERLTSIKTLNMNFNVMKKPVKLQGDEESFNVMDNAKFFQGKRLKPPGLFSKEGRSTCELLKFF